MMKMVGLNKLTWNPAPQPSNVKLKRVCPSSSGPVPAGADPPSDSCVNCYCRPMWCVDCMAKWYLKICKWERWCNGGGWRKMEEDDAKWWKMVQRRKMVQQRKMMKQRNMLQWGKYRHLKNKNENIGACLFLGLHRDKTKPIRKHGWDLVARVRRAG